MGMLHLLQYLMKVLYSGVHMNLSDEAHGLGVYGKTNVNDLNVPERQWQNERKRENADDPSKLKLEGRERGGLGVLSALGLETHPAILAAVYTFGKAAGCHGAVIVASVAVVQYLVNYARPFIYSTSLPPHSLLSVKCAYDTMFGEEGDLRRNKIFHLVALFRHRLLESLKSYSSLSTILLPSPSPIQAVLIPGNDRCIRLAEKMRNEGQFDVYPIRSPTVTKGSERIRIVIHFYNSEQEILDLVVFLTTALTSFASVSLPKSTFIKWEQRSKL